MKLNLLISLPLSMICLSAYAQAPAASTTTTTTATTAAPAATATATAATPAAGTSTAAAPAAAKKEEAPSVKFGFSYQFGYSIQAQQQPDGSRSQSLSHGLTPSMSYGEYRSSVNMTYEQDLVSTNETGAFSDPVFSLSKKSWALGDYFKLAPSGTFMLPVQAATKENTLYTIGGALGLNLNTKTLGMDALSLGYQLALTKYFTKYDTTTSGSPSRSHRMRNRVTAGYSLTDAVSLFTMLDFNSDYSVNGVVTNNFFTLQSVGYSINDNVSMSLSHSNGGAYLKAGTYENNLKVYDSENSSYGLSLEVSL